MGCVGERSEEKKRHGARTPTREQTAAKSTDSEIGMPFFIVITWSSSEF